MHLSTTLENYGADVANGLRLFKENRPELLPYAALLTARGQQDVDLKALCGVYEWQASPLVFIIDGYDLRGEDHFRLIRRCVALRGDAPYLAVVLPGQITVYSVGLDKDGYGGSQVEEVPQGDAKLVFPYLANTRPSIGPAKKWISSVVLRLLRDAIRELRQYGVANEDAISLTGRALFLRFLADRNLLPMKMGPPEKLFDHLQKAQLSLRWLDDIFNGDFLPLSDGLFQNLQQSALHPLGNILYRAPGGQPYLGWQEKWNYLDFAHIPVGVLSETYEHYMREHDQVRQRKEGSFYTPRAIADLMVNASFHALRREGRATKAVVLDPAAGAGVFLVSVFRQLVMERWAEDGKRPDTSVLREILYNQVVGFDINEAALRFAALGLYLMSIELDPEPEPVEKLRFKQNLRVGVLHDLSGGQFGGLGSLGAVSANHQGRYDLVIGNPPWASSTGLKRWSEVCSTVKKIARDRLPADRVSTLLPNEVLDLPFVWRAMEWAKAGGQIAFALHGRLLFLQGDGMPSARSALLSAIDVSAIINGAELRNTRVWPEISAPFCLLFAKNQVATDSAFRFVTPRLEPSLNNAGVMRIDAANAELVSARQVVARPGALKVLFRGSRLDLEIFEKISNSGLRTLQQYWCELFGVVRGKCRRAGNGYQRLRKSSRTRVNNTEPGVSASYLWDLPELVSEAVEGLLVDERALPPFKLPRIHDPRGRELFRGPLLLVHESPPVASGRIKVGVSDGDLVFNQSYHGYSTYSHPEAALLVRYVSLVLSSRPAMWWVLMTSGRFGVEREVVEKSTIDSLPIVPFESLDIVALGQIQELFDLVTESDTPDNWARVDAWVASLYELEARDLQVMDDTLRLNLPFSSNRIAAQAPPGKQEIAGFCETLHNELLPWASRENKVIEVLADRGCSMSPWIFFEIRGLSGEDESLHVLSDWPEVLRIADSLGSSEVLLPIPERKRVVIARLNQARYCSPSQARLVARRVVWEHLDALFGCEPRS